MASEDNGLELLKLHERVSLMMVVGLAHDRYMTLAHRVPTDIDVDPIVFAFPEKERTVAAAMFMRKNGYNVYVRKEDYKCVILGLSEAHLVDEEKEKEFHLDPSKLSKGSSSSES